MSSPYIYVPEANYQPSAYYNQPYSPYGSPFVPDLSLGGSPYSAGGSLPGSPHLGGGAPLQGGPAPFPGMFGGPPDPNWDTPTYVRPRQNSWHGANPLGQSNFLFAPPRAHGRSNSFGQYAAPPPVVPGIPPAFYPPPATAPIYSNWNPNSHSPWYRRFLALPTHRESQVYIHPWLNGEAPRPDFIFSLASPTFAPMRIVGPRGETALLGPEELSQPATYPYIHKLTVTHDKIPQWPVELVYLPPTPNMPVARDTMPPISVGDVLMTVYREMQKGITHHDWAGLSTREETAVARAFQRRCRSVGSQGQMQLRSMGVKRVDYLLDKAMFRGLVRTEDGLEKLKLITASA